MGTSVTPSAAWVLPAEPSAVREMRHRAVEFASTAGASDEAVDAIALAVSETVTNAVVHAYVGKEGGQVRVSCHADCERFVVEVADEGVGIGPGRDSSGIGHGLAMVGAVCRRSRSPPGRIAGGQS